MTFEELYQKLVDSGVEDSNYARAALEAMNMAGIINTDNFDELKSTVEYIIDDVKKQENWEDYKKTLSPEMKVLVGA